MGPQVTENRKKVEKKMRPQGEDINYFIYSMENSAPVEKDPQFPLAVFSKPW